MKQTHSSEKGQIIIILLGALLGLLGFTSLAVDGGMIYADRRYSQSAADAASLAGGSAAAEVVQDAKITASKWSCSDLSTSIGNAYIAAINNASTNDFTIEIQTNLGTPGVDHGVKVTCNDAGNYIDVDVMLSKVTKTSLVHLFTGAQMRNTVFSRTRVQPILKAGNGAAIVSLGDTCDKNHGGGVHFDSGSLVSILTGGGVYSNSCVTEQNNADVQIEYGSLDCHDGFECEAAGLTPNFNNEYHPLTNTELNPNLGKRCSNLNDYGSSDGDPDNDGTFTIGPGNYSSWDFKDPVTLQPGLYCVTGTVKMTAGGEISGHGITIYYTGSDLTINGHADSSLTAPNSPSDPPDHFAEEDVLLYVPPGINADIKINGTSNNVFGGTLYAPDCEYTITGTSQEENATQMNVSIIGKVIKISGTSYIDIVYDEDLDAGWPAYIQVQK